MTHALILGAAIALFLFILCWAGEATGAYPPAGDLIDFMTGATERRSADVFWRGAGSAAVAGAVIAALIALSADGLSRLSKRRD
jgi:hypothetical protein